MNKQLKYKIIAATPLFCLILFLILGFADDFGFSSKPLWHPGWVVFLLIPIVPMILGVKQITISYTTICVIIFLLIGFIFDKWHPGWIVFLTIPLVHIFTSRAKFTIGRKPKDYID